MRSLINFKPRNGPRLIVIAMCIALLMLLICSSVLLYTVYAEDDPEPLYSNVLDDLSKDETFDASKYPVKESDYKLRVIQIGEGMNGALFIYVYQPSGTDDLIASNISISTELSNTPGFSPRLYALKELSHSGTLYKYLVLDFAVNTEHRKRYYVFPEIFRLPISGVDNNVNETAGNVQNEYSIRVGQCWVASTVGNGVIYEMSEESVISVKDKYVGYTRRESQRDSSLFYNEYDTSFFIAFSTDIKMDTVYESDIEFQIFDFDLFNLQTKGSSIEFLENCANDKCRHGIDLKWKGKKSKNTDIHDVYSNFEPNVMYGYLSPTQTVTIRCDTKVNVNLGGSWFFALGKKSFSYKSIVSSKDFLSANPLLTDVAQDEIKKMDWVITYWSHNEYEGISHHTPFYMPGPSAILRLNYIADGITYNVGVVDNKTSDYLRSDKDKSGWSIWTYVILIIAIVLFVLALPFIIKGIIWFVHWLIGLFVGGDDV